MSGSAAHVPLKSRGRLVGVLSSQSYASDAFDDEDLGTGTEQPDEVRDRRADRAPTDDNDVTPHPCSHFESVGVRSLAR